MADPNEPSQSPDVKKMLAELERALKEDQASKRQGFAETTALARDAKEKQILDDVERRSREATSRLQAMPPAPMPVVTQPNFDAMGPTSALAPQPAPAPGPMPGPGGGMPGPMPGPGPIAMAGPVPTQPLPTGMPAPQPLPTGMPPAQPMTADQWAMLQRQVYG